MIDKKLRIVLTHEFKRCNDSFCTFARLHLSLLKGSQDQHTRIDFYNAYIDFVSHLYEFYAALIKNDSRYKKLHINQAMNSEAAIVLRIRRDRILRGDAADYENDISYYKINVPEKF